MDYGQLSYDEIKAGYRLNTETNTYVCNYCDKPFPSGQVFTIGENQYLPEAAVARHIETEHGGNLSQLLHSDTKYNTLSDNQKELLALFASDVPDKDIAQQLGITPSTVRHQKFMFREKAKQAKLYLALFEQVFANRPPSEESIVPIHNHATYYDDRYIITEQEKARVLETAFESLDPLWLKAFPAKEKKKVVVLTKIAEQFELGRTYDEKEVNEILRSVVEDYGTIRRFLIMYGFMDRAADGSRYWLTT